MRPNFFNPSPLPAVAAGSNNILPPNPSLTPIPSSPSPIPNPSPPISPSLRHFPRRRRVFYLMASLILLSLLLVISTTLPQLSLSQISLIPLLVQSWHDATDTAAGVATWRDEVSAARLAQIHPFISLLDYRQAFQNGNSSSSLSLLSLAKIISPRELLVPSISLVNARKVVPFLQLSVKVMLLYENQTAFPSNSRESARILHDLCTQTAELLDGLLLPSRHSIKCGRYPYDSSTLNIRDSYKKTLEGGEGGGMEAEGGYYLDREALIKIVASGDFKTRLFGRDISICHNCLEYNLVVYVPADEGGERPFKIIDEGYSEGGAVTEGSSFISYFSRPGISSIDLTDGPSPSDSRMSIMAVPSMWIFDSNRRKLLYRGLCERLENLLGIKSSSNSYRNISINNSTDDTSGDGTCMSVESINTWRLAYTRALRDQSGLHLTSVSDYLRRGLEGSEVYSHEINGAAFVSDYREAMRLLSCADIVMGDLRAAAMGSELTDWDSQVRLECISELTARLNNNYNDTSSNINVCATCYTDDSCCEGDLQINMLDIVTQLVFEAYSISTALSSSEHLLATHDVADDLIFICNLLPYWFPLLLSLTLRWIHDSPFPAFARWLIRQILPKTLANKLAPYKPWENN